MSILIYFRFNCNEINNVFLVIYIYDLDGNNQYYYQCQQGWNLIGDKCYKGSQTRVTIFTAIFKCASLNASLPIIDSDDVLNQLITTFHSNITQYWINLFKTVNNSGIYWRWKNHPDLHYLRWGASQPQSSKYYKFCSIFNGLLNPSGFDDVSCFGLAKYICQQGKHYLLSFVKMLMVEFRSDTY